MKRLNPRATIWFFVKQTPGLWLVLPALAFYIFLTYGGKSVTAAAPEFFGPTMAILVAALGVIIPGMLVLFLIWSWLWYQSFQYQLTDTEFRKEFGVIHKHYVSIPYEQVQNVDIHRGIFDRILGLSELLIQTAGLSETRLDPKLHRVTAEGHLPGLSKHEAENLRSELVKRASLSQ